MSNQICTRNITRGVATVHPTQISTVEWSQNTSKPKFHRGTFAGLLHLYRGTKPMRIALSQPCWPIFHLHRGIKPIRKVCGHGAAGRLSPEIKLRRKVPASTGPLTFNRGKTYVHCSSAMTWASCIPGHDKLPVKFVDAVAKDQQQSG